MIWIYTIKKDLPKNIKYLWLTAPNSITTKFNIYEDNYDLYKISVHSFDKYNKYVGGYLCDNYDNIKYYQVFYHYEVDGDIYPNVKE